ncbi:MAG: hypothetical protein AB3N21_13910, partial [Ruegeria sp.]|uniref:hypothetical protein n=1 Tax=Ruegeria sp. TaxID=1879320 RepID=UPI00349EE32B
TRFALLQHADDLFFGETLPLHGSSSLVHSKVENSSSQWPENRGEGQLHHDAFLPAFEKITENEAFTS